VTGQGLYYVKQDASKAYPLNLPNDLKRDSAFDLQLAAELLRTFGADSLDAAYAALHGRRDPCIQPAHPITPQVFYPNELGAPFGLYYVTRSGNVYGLMEISYPPLDCKEMPFFGALLTWAKRDVNLGLDGI